MRLIRHSDGWLAILALLLMNGCTSMRPEPGLEVTLADLRFSDATLMETTVQFVVRIENATPEPIALQGGVYRLSLNGMSLGKGMTGDTVEVPRFSSVTQPVAVHLSNLRMASRVRPILESGRIDYRLESLLYPVRGRSISIRREGTLDLHEHQKGPGRQGGRSGPLEGRAAVAYSKPTASRGWQHSPGFEGGSQGARGDGALAPLVFPAAEEESRPQR
jgi:LEA14-like dessication related protein